MTVGEALSPTQGAHRLVGEMESQLDGVVNQTRAIAKGTSETEEEANVSWRRCRLSC